ncbi:hypothetical protein Pan153_19340 [Gimesia panareensis]|uniref:Uncharacterized protein n=1 Tax=Gimesia panareensis TaxID=2527978 RepID=A0A518FLU9_9PLAN|nr:hypothetical protein [Gimesia panareensis]QDV17299.1 hypothetical protein Pan153_19340 [Gimesia panareensis]
MTDYLSSLAIWTGAIIGLLKIVDWLLLDSQKKWITEKFESLWLWLSEQRMGKFTSLVQSRRTQVGFSIFTHVAMITIILSFLARVFLGFNIDASIELGHPRIYSYQVWVDVFALIISMILVSKIIHPRITLWITDTKKISTYYLRSYSAFSTSFVSMILILLIQWPIMYFLFDAPVVGGNEAGVRYVENTFGGQLGVTILHAVTAVISAPVLTEAFMLQTILFLSICWFIIVVFLIVIFRILQFILLRIVENKNGPVLALSGFLVGVGAIAKAIIT